MAQRGGRYEFDEMRVNGRLCHSNPFDPVPFSGITLPKTVTVCVIACG